MRRRGPNSIEDTEQRYVTCQSCGRDVAAEDAEYHKENECGADREGGDG